jgi:hypothetical protein
MNAKTVRDIVERVLATFAFAFVTLLVAVPSEDWSADTAKKAAVAGAVAALSLVKGLLASWLPFGTSSASLDPQV